LGKASRYTAALLGVIGCLATLCVPQVGATELTSVGYLDQGAIEATAPFHDAQAQLAQEKAGLDSAYRQAMHGVSGQAEQREIAQRFSARFAQRQAELLGPLYSRARAIIAEIAAKRALSVVVDRRIIIVGGLDITPEVLTRLGSMQPVSRQAPVLPPSSVGFVDQNQINTIDRVKRANTQFVDAQKSIESDAATRLKAAKSDTERNSVTDHVQQAEAAKQHDIIDPIVAQVNAAIAGAANQRGLILVVDKDSIMIGGTDVTADVVKALH
jgi:outer membrane protein